jgi:hypothetical protein
MPLIKQENIHRLVTYQSESPTNSNFIKGLDVWPPSLNWLLIYWVAQQAELGLVGHIQSNSDLDAAIQASFVGSVHDHYLCSCMYPFPA